MPIISTCINVVTSKSMPMFIRISMLHSDCWKLYIDSAGLHTYKRNTAKPLMCSSFSTFAFVRKKPGRHSATSISAFNPVISKFIALFYHNRKKY